MIIRRRKLKLNQIEKLIPIKKKFEKREKNREKKALVAANLEIAIEKELLNRLKEGVYPKEIYNIDQKKFEEALREHEIEEEKQYEMDEDSDEEESEEEREFVEEDIDDIDDIEDFDDLQDDEDEEERPRKAVEIEYENEYEMEDQQQKY